MSSNIIRVASNSWSVSSSRDTSITPATTVLQATFPKQETSNIIFLTRNKIENENFGNIYVGDSDKNL
jgi:hypothetical protein